MATSAAIIVAFALAIIGVQAFSGGDDKFIKKYAMMKIYESCFGPEVVKQIRKEMKAACLKCAAIPDQPGALPMHQGAGMRPLSQRPSSAEISQTANSQLRPQQGSTKLEDVIAQSHENAVHQQLPGFDVEKLHQAILAYRPNTYQSQAQFRPFPGVTPFYPTPYGAQMPNPIFYSPAAAPFSPYSQFPGAFYPQQFYPQGQRMSRDMNMGDQLEALTNRMSGRVRNVTCVMQELGYLDENLEPNYDKILSRIENLPVADELRKDMQDGVTFCQQFSQCIPDVKREKSPLSRELVKPMFFFRCYKHKKLEACIMKDVREKFNQDSDGDFESLADGIRSSDDVRYRSSKSFKLDPEEDGIAVSMYDFLYGSTDVEMDSLL